jgi:hypothetical protein
VSFRFAKPRKASDQKLLDSMQDELDVAIRRSLSLLSVNAGVSAGDLGATAVEEPPLPAARNADGFLSGVEPIQFIS